jgi:hypothetical protein
MNDLNTSCDSEKYCRHMLFNSHRTALITTQPTNSHTGPLPLLLNQLTPTQDRSHYYSTNLLPHRTALITTQPTNSHTGPLSLPLNQLTSWSNALLEELTVHSTGQDILLLCRTRMFSAVFTTAHHRSTSRTRRAQATSYKTIPAKSISVVP